MYPVPDQSRYGQFTSLAGIPGQNSGQASPSEKAFAAHFFAKVNGKYYDASYGVEYTGASDFEDKAVFGFFEDMEAVSATPTKPKHWIAKFESKGQPKSIVITP